MATTNVRYIVEGEIQVTSGTPVVEFEEKRED